MPKKGGRRRKTHTHNLGEGPKGAALTADEQGEQRVPKSFVFRKGKVHQNVHDLISDLRRMMEPNTARNLRERSKNTLKDYVEVCGPLGITHLLMLSQTSASLTYRITRAPEGPTLTFKVVKYSLTRHVRSLHKRPLEASVAFRTAPLVILNNFGDSSAASQVKLMKITFQNMFPQINVSYVKLAECRRVVLFDYNKDTEEVLMRHYLVTAVPSGLTRAVKKVVQAKTPDLHRLEDISDYVNGLGGAGGLSDSEAEDEDAKVVLPDRYVGRGNSKAQKSAIKLQELGPRMSLQLMKVERGLCNGATLYHSYIHKTPEEAAATKAKVEEKDRLRRKRKAEQAENVAKKKAREEEKKAKRDKDREERRQKKLAAGEEEDDEEDEDDDEDDGEDDDDEEGGQDGDSEAEGGSEEEDEEEEDEEEDEDEEESQEEDN